MTELLIGIILFMTVLAAFFGYRWSKAVNEVARGIVALGEGRPTRPTLLKVGGPLGRLADRFDTVAPELEEKIARLEQDRQQLRAVLSVMAEAVIAIDARRRLVFANASADRLFGLDLAAVGRLVPELIRSPQIQEAVDATLAGTEPHEGEIAMANREALLRVHDRVLAVHGTPLPGTPPPGAVLVSATELRRLGG